MSSPPMASLNLGPTMCDTCAVSQFEWKTDDDDQWQTPEVVQPKNGRFGWRSRAFLAFSALLIIGALLLFRRADRSMDQVEQSVVDWSEQLEGATLAGDVDLAAALLGGSDWAFEEAAARSDGSRFDRRIFGLEQVSVELPRSIHFSSDLLNVTLTTMVRYQPLFEADSAEPVHLYFPIQLQQSDQGWRALPPPDWDQPRQSEIASNRSFTITEAHKPFAVAVNAAIDAIIAPACSTLPPSDCDLLRQMQTETQTDYAQDSALFWAQQGQRRNAAAAPDSTLVLLSPATFGVPSDARAERVMQDAYTRLILRDMVARQANMPCCAYDHATDRAVTALFQLLQSDTGPVSRNMYSRLAETTPQLNDLFQPLASSSSAAVGLVPPERHAARRFLSEATDASQIAIALRLAGLDSAETILIPPQAAWEQFITARAKASSLPVPNSRLVAACGDNRGSQLLSTSYDDATWQPLYQSPANMRAEIDAIGDSGFVWVTEHDGPDAGLGRIRSSVLTEQGPILVNEASTASAERGLAFIENPANPIVDGQLGVMLVGDRSEAALAQLDLNACSQGDSCELGEQREPLGRTSYRTRSIAYGPRKLTLSFLDDGLSGGQPVALLQLESDDGSVISFDLPQNIFWTAPVWINENTFALRGWPSDDRPGPEVWVGEAGSTTLRQLTIDNFRAAMPLQLKAATYQINDVFSVAGERGLVLVSPVNALSLENQGILLFEYGGGNSAEFVAQFETANVSNVRGLLNGRYLVLEANQAVYEEQRITIVYDSVTRLSMKSINKLQPSFYRYSEPLAAFGDWVAIPQTDYIELLSPATQTRSRIFTYQDNCYDAVWLPD